MNVRSFFICVCLLAASTILWHSATSHANKIPPPEDVPPVQIVQVKPPPVPVAPTVTPEPPKPAPTKPASLSYVESQKKAIAEGKPFVVCNMLPVRPFPGAVVYSSSSGLEGFAEPCVIIYGQANGSLFWKATLPADVSTDRATALLRGRGEEVMAEPVFFTQGADKDGRADGANADGNQNKVTGPWLPSDEQNRIRTDVWPAGVAVPKGLRFFRRTRWTQQLSHMNGVPSTFPHPIGSGDDPNMRFPYRVPGGLENATGWHSYVGVSIPEGAKVNVWRDGVPVSVAPYGWLPKQQHEWPDGTIFADLLVNANDEPFEVRVREKEKESWDAYRMFTKIETRPPGYVRPKIRDCNACHEKPEPSVYSVNLRRQDTVFTASPLVPGTLTPDHGNWPIKQWESR